MKIIANKVIYTVPEGLEELFRNSIKSNQEATDFLSNHLSDALERSPKVTGKVEFFDAELVEEE